MPNIQPVERSTSLQWNNATQGANLYSTGASGPVAVRPVHAVNAVESTDKLGEGVTVTLKTAADRAEKPTDRSAKDLDWTTKLAQQEHALKTEKEDENKEPMYKQLMEFVQSMWRASAQAVEAAEQTQRIDQHERSSLLVRDYQGATYAEPRVKRTGGL